MLQKSENSHIRTLREELIYERYWGMAGMILLTQLDFYMRLVTDPGSPSRLKEETTLSQISLPQNFLRQHFS